MVTRILIWVQLHDQAVEFVNRECRTYMASIVGQVAKVEDNDYFPNNDHYIRARMWILINLPLLSGFLYCFDDGRSIWALCSYEEYF